MIRYGEKRDYRVDILRGSGTLSIAANTSIGVAKLRRRYEKLYPCSIVEVFELFKYK